MSFKIGSLYEGLYSITSDGKLYSARSGRFLKPTSDKHGYLYFVISIGGKRKTLKAHRLVADAFIPNPECKPTVNHKNGIRSDNRVENLEWATAKEQSEDAAKRDALPGVWARTDYRAMGAKRNFGRRKTAVYQGRRLLGVYGSLMEAANTHTTQTTQKHLNAPTVKEKRQEARYFVSYRKFIFGKRRFRTGCNNVRRHTYMGVRD